MLFTDEATFTKDGITKKQNPHSSSFENPHGRNTFPTGFQCMCGVLASISYIQVNTNCLLVKSPPYISESSLWNSK
jgi:hypothetical protein